MASRDRLATSVLLEHHPQVFEYCETDLELVIKDSSLIFSAADVKSYMQVVCCCTYTRQSKDMHGTAQEAPADMARELSSNINLGHRSSSSTNADGAQGADVLPRSMGAAPRHQAQQLPDCP